MKRDTVVGTFTVAALLCVVCSLLVSGAAVGLRPLQTRNRALEKKRNILEAAGIESGRNAAAVDEAFRRIETRIIDLESGEEVGPETIDPATYDPVAAARDPELSVAIPEDKDLASIKRREKYSLVYLVKSDSGEVEQIVLPVRGMGLWGTLYGFVSIDSDLRTIRGLTFYQHSETPGLGGEVDNPSWKEKWKGKLLFDDGGDVRIQVSKGTVDSGSPQSKYQVDGLSGATITSRGVTNLLRYWFGDHGFGPYLDELREHEETDNGSP
ncbi:MAG: Na(+)-translocating NADH-quinone reductase subunit C [Pirellulaceae bacterium]